MAMSVKMFDALEVKDFQDGAIRSILRRTLVELERINDAGETDAKNPGCTCITLPCTLSFGCPVHDKNRTANLTLTG